MKVTAYLNKQVLLQEFPLLNYDQTVMIITLR